ncbi:MAG: alpha/beta fold hydrolase [Cyanobacteria bacterium]|nr:alpha/beta fold hydrolase [Cyanobacteriota bacterium]
MVNFPAINPVSLGSPVTPLGQERYFPVRGWRIRYTVLLPQDPVAQQKPPLLLLHGFGASLNQWRDNLPVLAQHQPVYALDLLGFGGSQKAATLLNSDLWQAQVYDFWRQWIRRPMVLLGHSLGALVALDLAIAHPETLYRLVLLTLPAAREELLSGWLEKVARTMERLFSTPLLIRPVFYGVRRPGILRAALRSIYQRRDRVDEALVQQYVQPTRDRGAARTLCYLVRSRTEVQFTPATKPLVAQLQGPTLLLWGEADQVIPLSWGQQLAPLSPYVTLKPVPGGHCLFDEEPERFNQYLLAWLHES